MGHVRREQLYPLFHVLVLHRQGRAPLDGLDLDPDLARVLRKVPEEAFATPPDPGRALSGDRVREVLDHARACKECQILVYEEGPYARRPKTARELAEEREAWEREKRRMRRRFFLSAGYGTAAFVGANLAITEYRNLQLAARKVEGPVLRQLDEPAFQLHPLQILFGALILVAAWGLAEAWRIANVLWLDFTRFKAAVPFIGQRWAERSRRERERWGPPGAGPGGA
ncbi:MAG: hypothetical protein HY722_06285 [Planctomycetes bacterium]|nr:hypothetical protein [Planctomycetota bacterium]